MADNLTPGDRFNRSLPPEGQLNANRGTRHWGGAIWHNYTWRFGQSEWRSADGQCCIRDLQYSDSRGEKWHVAYVNGQAIRSTGKFRKARKFKHLEDAAVAALRLCGGLK